MASVEDAEKHVAACEDQVRRQWAVVQELLLNDPLGLLVTVRHQLTSYEHILLDAREALKQLRESSS